MNKNDYLSRRLKWLLSAVLIAGLGLFSFISTLQGEVPKKDDPILQNQSFLIGFLHTRTLIVSIQVSTVGPVYSVKTFDGEWLAIALSKKTLLARFPDLQQTLDSGIAANDARLWILE